MDYIIAAHTDIGIKKSTNQDSFNARILSTGQGKMVFAILCDGMGGLAKGEVASATVVKAFTNWADDRLPELCEGEIKDNQIREEWKNIIAEYNEKIKDYGDARDISLGTTATVILITDTRYYILNVGDSRAYELTDQATILTKDQTVVAREVELGRLTEEEALVDPRRSVLLQCVGASDAVYPDMFYGDTQPNAVYMLCSDGFRHEITKEEILEHLGPQAVTNESELGRGIRTLIDLNKERQEKDNISAVAIRTL